MDINKRKGEKIWETYPKKVQKRKVRRRTKKEYFEILMSKNIKTFKEFERELRILDEENGKRRDDIERIVNKLEKESENLRLDMLFLEELYFWKAEEMFEEYKKISSLLIYGNE